MGIAALGTSLLTRSADLYGFNGLKVALPRSAPEEQGISSAGIMTFLDAIAKNGTEFHSLMIIRHGKVVTEGWWSPYAPELNHTLYSLSKSFTSTAVGLAIADGKFKLDSKVVSFFSDDLPKEVSANLAAMNIQHLLEMGTGNAKDTMATIRAANDPNWTKIFLAQPVEHEPGTHFVYNTGATYMLSAIVQKTTGKTLVEYLKPRLFDPLGIENYDWEMSPQGICTGGFGLRVRTEDIAKFGQLYLQKGKWDGKQLLPAEWVADATAYHIDNKPGTADWAQGYGYQFWRCTHNGVRGDGAFGQFCIMLPEQDTVVVITEESFNLQASIDLVWSDLLPAIKSGSLPVDSVNANRLQQRLKALAIAPPVGELSSPMVSKISGKEFALDSNDFKAKSISFKFTDGPGVFTLKDEKGEYRVNFGMGKWKEEKNFKTQQIFPMTGRPAVATPLVASAVWTDEDENMLLMTLRYSATAHSDNIYFKFDGNSVSIKFLNSVAKGNPSAGEKRGSLAGKW